MIKKDDSDEQVPAGSASEPTRIDLGDDLIEKTAILPGHFDGQAGVGSSAPGSIVTSAGVEDQLQSAHILLGEGFPDEAKKILRQILVLDPEHREARKLLEEIHESELKQMFGTAEPVRRKPLVTLYDESILDSDSDEILRLLEHDMRLELKGVAEELSFFEDQELVAGFASKLEREIGDSAQDRVDLAIGFIEMGLYSVSLRLLQPLLSSPIEGQRLNAVALVAYVRILDEEYYEAISVLQPVLNDNDVAKAAKTEIFYLMARALQALSLHAEAIGWFLQVQENEPGYRDCVERASRSQMALSRLRGPGSRR